MIFKQENNGNIDKMYADFTRRLIEQYPDAFKVSTDSIVLDTDKLKIEPESVSKINRDWWFKMCGRCLTKHNKGYVDKKYFTMYLYCKERYEE
jgi:hypothetical protein